MLRLRPLFIRVRDRLAARLAERPIVRPWALATPILVLLVTLPLLRPLRHPDPREVSDQEAARLATVQALVEQHTFAIDRTSFSLPATSAVRVNGQTFSDQPRMLAWLLAGPYWVMHRLGLTFDTNPVLTPYLLTVLGIALPVALACGLIYRMGRLFELSRPMRACLAMVVAFGSGLVSYSTVINAHASAAALLIAATACLVHVTIAKRPSHNASWLMLAGLCAAMAAAIDHAAIVFTVALMPVILAIRWSPGMRVAGVLLYLLGAAPAVALHGTLTVPLTGDLLAAQLHPELERPSVAAVEVFDERARLAASSAGPAAVESSTAALVASLVADEEPAQPLAWYERLGRTVVQVLKGLFGAHGVFTHFPVMVFAILGIAAVMHRHWLASTKTLAVVTVAGSLTIVVGCAARHVHWATAMFAAKWFIPFLPLLLFWSGAWLRRRHHPATWTVAAVALVFSITVTVLGATQPFPRDGYEDYTPAGALARLVQPPAPVTGPMLAGG
jgi:hypothetical protein